MANVYTGDDKDAIFIHTLNGKDADIIGPGAYTLKNGATIELSPSKFGSSLLCDANFERLDSDSAVANFDHSDTAKMMYHFFWRTPTLAAQQGQITWINSGGTLFKTRIFWDTGVQRMFVQWVRSTDLSPGKPAISISSTASQFSTNVFSAISAYVNASGTSEGKLFKDGVDITSAVTEELASTRGTTGFDFIRLGNHFNGLDPARFLDHVTIIQSPTLSDARATLLSGLYFAVRSFGFRPVIASISSNVNNPSELIINGEGFGPDATVTFDGQAGTNIRVFGDDTIVVTPPAGIGLNPVIAVTNVASNVTVTEDALSIAGATSPPPPTNITQSSAAIVVQPPAFAAIQGLIAFLASLGQSARTSTGFKRTIWTENGLSNRPIIAGDNITPEMGVIAGDPLPIYNPRIRPTVWTQTQPFPLPRL